MKKRKVENTERKVGVAYEYNDTIHDIAET